MSGTDRKCDVFFSYHWSDHAAVETVARALREQGLTVFLDRWYLVAGRPWSQVLEEALTTCKAACVFLGPQGMGRWQQREKELALDRQVHDPAFPVVPVLLPGAEPALGFLSLNTWVDMRTGIDDPGPIAVMAAAVRRQPPSPELIELVNATLATVCPYRGLRPFREEDAPLFFGREVFTARLAEAVAQHTVIALVGASGCGKSSVARAGLVPYIRKGVGGQVWDVATLVPGDRPLHALAAALVPLLEPEMAEIDRLAEIGKLAGHFADRNVNLRDVVARVLERQAGTDHLLLMVDQWEELYTLTDDDRIRQRFVDELLEAAERRPLTVVLTLRGDFYGRVLEYRALADRLQDAVVNLGPMNREELGRAIEAPAQKVGLTFEPGLVHRILDDVGEEPGNLPLLEFVLTSLWEQRHRGMLLHEAYDATGEVQGAMSHRADEVFGKLSPAEQKVVRRIFTQLVRPGEGTEATRRRATLGEMGEAARPVVQKLADARLMVTSCREATGEQTIEVAHEALIHNWALLKTWMDEDKELLLWRQRLRAHLGDWEHTKREKGGLLRGALLTEAEHWRDERADDISSSERDFIAESAALREQEQTVRERRRKRIAIGLVAGLLVALTLAGLAGSQWRRAEKERQKALARQLVAQAELLTDQKASLQQCSVLLAVESMLRFPSLEADQALRHGLALLAQPVAAMKHKGPVRRVVFSPDGRYVATASDDCSAGIWDTITGQSVAVTHNQPVVSVAFSPDGTRVATASMDLSARIWDTNSGEEMSPPMPHSYAVRCVVFSPAGKYIGTASDKTACVWDAISHKSVAQMNHQTIVLRIAFSPNEKYLATASDNTARVWDANSGTTVARLPHQGAVEDVVFSPDGRYLATASDDETASLWDWTTEKQVCCMKHEGAVSFVVFSPTGNRLATASLDVVQVWAWNEARHEKVTLMKHEASVLSLAFSPDGKYVATASDRNTAQVWDASSGKEVARMNHEGSVHSVAVSPDGKLVATASNDNTARMWKWKATAGDEVIRIDHNDTVLSAALSPDGECVVTASRDATVWLWEAATGGLRTHKLADSPVSLLAFSRDGKHVAAVDNGNTLRLWDLDTNDWGPPLLPGYLIRDIAFRPDGKLLATTTQGCATVVWNVTDGNERASRSHKDPVSAAAFSPDEKYLATVCNDDTARLWDRSREKQVHCMKHAGNVSRVVFSPDGKYLATVSSDAVVWVWDVTSGKRVTEMNHTAIVSSVAFSPDGTHLATGSEDGTLRVWDARTGLEVARMKHERKVCSIVFSPDGKYIATASEDETARVWVWRPDDLMAQACSRLTRNLTCEEWQKYLPGESYRKTCPDLPGPAEPRSGH